jgi:sigma-E factor negative regulatory protein RseB
VVNAAGRRTGSGYHSLMHRGAACALLLLTLALPATASDDGAAWLSRMAEALSGLDYQGTFVYVRDGQVDALRIVHRRDASGSRERLSTLSGEPRDLARSGPHARLHGGIAAALAAPTLGPATSADPATLARHYQLVVAGRDRVAAMPTQIVEIRPRDSFRYGYRLWLEEASAMPLKSVAYGSDGVAVEQWMFTSIRLGERPDDAALGPPVAAAADSAPAMPVPAGFTPRWRVPHAPRGYQLVHAMPIAGGGEHHLYSDGLARVSLYVEPLTGSGANLSGLLRRGALSVFGRVLSGAQQITVVGEVPAVTVERFAQGIEATDER